MFKIPFSEIRIGFWFGHWVDAAEMTNTSMKGVFCWPTNTYWSFGLLKEKCGSDYLFVLTHQGELKD